MLIRYRHQVVRLQAEVGEATAAAEKAKGEGKEEEAKALLEKAEVVVFMY